MRRATVEPGGLTADVVALDDDRAHHLRDVLRLPEGELIDLCDGAGARARGRLEGGRVVIVDRDPPAPSPRPDISILQGWAKGEKMDRVVRQVAELGARRFTPVNTARAVPRGGGKPDRWRAIAEDALRVSGRPFRMKIEPVQTLRAVMAQGAERGALRLVFDARGLDRVTDLPAEPPDAVWLLVGPEGGFDPDELEALTSCGFRAIRLGDANLRTETAAPAALAALTLGRWGAP